MKKFLKPLVAVLAVSLIFTACSDKAPGGGTKPKARKAVESEQLQFTPPKSGDTIVTFDTSRGTIKAVLYPQYAPQAVENFIGLAEQGYFDGLIFHRVVKDFVIQSGDDTKTGAGGKTIWNDNPFSVEISDKLFHYSGALGVARVSGDLNSCRSQFYIVQTPQDSIDKDTAKALSDAGFPEEIVNTYTSAGGAPSLDGQYTVFGQVYEGLAVVDEIGYTEAKNDKPVEDVIVNSVTVSIME